MPAVGADSQVMPKNVLYGTRKYNVAEISVIVTPCRNQERGRRGV